jgi:uncharacterized protein YjbI with pentapeptide repeats
MEAATPIENRDQHYPPKRTLLAAANACATTARYGSIASSALVGYFFVTIASLTHKDLLLNTPVMLPFLQVQIPLLRFFVFAPILLLVVHSLVLVQHVILRGMIDAFNGSLGDGAAKDDPLRLELNSYFFVQAYAGPRRRVLITVIFFSVSWLTLVLLPVLAFLYFQVAFLPRHDTAVTWAHRIYLTLDLVFLFLMGTLILFPGTKLLSAPLHKLFYSPLLSLGVHSTILFALFFSYCVATLPGSKMDAFMRGIDERASRLAKKTWGGKAGDKNMPQSLVLLEKDREHPVFWATAWLFEGVPDKITGKTTSLFARNLVVMNTDLVPDEDAKEAANEVSLQLRGRDLRHARLDGSDLHRADMTGADLKHASLVRTNISKARLDEADLRYSNLNWAKMNGARLDEADLRDSVLREAELVKASLSRADMRGTILSWAKLDEANLSRADMRRATLSWAEIDGAKLVWTNLEDANLFGATLRGAKLEHWQLNRTVLANADLGPVDDKLAESIRSASPSGSHELHGVWIGEVEQPKFAGTNKSYTVKLSINEFGNGFVDYPGLSCMGLNSGVKYGGVYVFEERIDRGREYCRDGHVKIGVSGNDMTWTWYYADGRFGASGVLKKQE